MRGWLRNLLIVIGLLLVLAGGLVYWFLLDAGSPSGLKPFEFDIAELRALADEIEGDKPSAIRVETVATFSAPAMLAMAGSGLGTLDLGAFSFQIVLPDRTILVDTAFDAALDKTIPAKPDPMAFTRMEAVMSSAAMIVVTSERPEHIGGILTYPMPQAIGAALRLTDAQIAHAADYQTVPPQVFADAEPIAYDKYLAIAPGVVLAKAPGPSPGGQMVYVQRDDGQEILFAGDIGWISRALETGRARPRFASDVILHEDRAAVLAELDTLRELHAAEPELAIIAGHDLAQIDSLVAQGTLDRGFVK